MFHICCISGKTFGGIYRLNYVKGVKTKVRVVIILVIMKNNMSHVQSMCPSLSRTYEYTGLKSHIKPTTNNNIYANRNPTLENNDIILSTYDDMHVVRYKHILGDVYLIGYS